MKFKTLTIAAVAALIAVPALAAPDRYGRIIGDGIKLPREVVPGRAPKQRVKEIGQWLTDRGGQFARNCYPKQRMCQEAVTMKLSDGGFLSINFFQYYGGSGRDHNTYCRVAPTLDTMACYGMQSGKYFAKMKDAATNEWADLDFGNDDNTSSHEKSVSSDDVL